MALGKVTGATNSSTSATNTINAPGSGSVNVSAGDIIVGAVLINASSISLGSITKASGTATIGTPTLRTKVTNGSIVGLTMFFVSVTGSGTLVLTATTASGNWVDACFVYEVYSGGSSINQPTVSSNTGTGVDLHATLTAGFSGSWIIQVGGKHGAAAIATGTNAGETHSTVDRVVAANPSGTTNDINCAVGTPGSDTVANTAYTVDMNGSSGDVYASDAIELKAILSAQVNISGTASGGQADTVPTNLKAVSVLESDTVSNIISQIKSVSVTEANTIANIISQIIAASVTANVSVSGEVGQPPSGEEIALDGFINASVLNQVLENLKSVTVTESSALALIASSLKILNVLANDSINVVNATSKSVNVSESSVLLAEILTNLKSVVVTANCSVSCIALNLVNGSGNSIATIVLFVSNQSINASGRMRTSLICESSTPQSQDPVEVPLDAGWIITNRRKRRVVY